MVTTNLRVRVTKLYSSHKIMRTEFIEGTALTNLEVGGRLTIEGEPLDKAFDKRYFTTSDIVRIEHLPDGSHQFETLNSVYLLRFIS